MRTTVDLPDATYRRLKAKAALEGCTVREIILRLVDQELRGAPSSRHTDFPLIRGREKRTLNLTNADIHEILSG